MLNSSNGYGPSTEASEWEFRALTGDSFRAPICEKCTACDGRYLPVAPVSHQICADPKASPERTIELRVAGPRALQLAGLRELQVAGLRVESVASLIGIRSCLHSDGPYSNTTMQIRLTPSHHE